MRRMWIVLAALTLAGCESETLTTAEREMLEEMVLGPEAAAPEDPTNAVADDPDAAALGRMFFFETRFSGNLVIGNDGLNGALGASGDPEKIACASCHDLKRGGADTRSRGPTSLGAKWTGRNAPTIFNAGFLTFNHWDGRHYPLWNGCLAPVEGALASSRLKVAHRVYELYRTEYEALFGAMPDLSDTVRFPATGKPGDPNWDGMADADKEAVNRIWANFGKAIAAFYRQLLDKNSAFDRYMLGEEDALSPAAIRGAKLFVGKASCNECHNGPLFADGGFHNLGVAQTGPYVPAVDMGRTPGINQVLANSLNGASIFSDDPDFGAEFLARYSPFPDEALTNCNGFQGCGAFKTSPLRSVALTGPYMHTGGLETLWDVVEFYSEGGGTDRYTGEKDPKIRPLHLSDQEIGDLVEFLRSITGEPIPAALSDVPELPPTP